MKKRRVLSAFLAVVILIGIAPIMPVEVEAYTNHTQSEATDWIIARGNESWWKDVDLINGCQCVDLIMEYYEYLVGYHVGGSGCDYTWNNLPSGWYRDNTPSPGSIAVWGSYAYGDSSWSFDKNGHVALVYSVNGSTIYTVDTNSGGSQEAKFKERKASYVTTYIHPDFSGSVPSYTVDTSYPTPFYAYTNSSENVQCYSSVNGGASGYVYPEDKCTILEVYTNGWCKFECPWPDYNNMQVKYAPLSIFNVNVPSYVDIGTNFTAPIFNYEHWKIIENNNGIVQTANETGKANQLWYFERQSDGSYKICSCVDGSCLDVDSASSEAYAKVQVCESNDSNAQRWYIYEQDGGYVLKAKCTDCVLDMPDNDPTPGNQLIMYHRNNTGAQIWSIYRGGECILSAPNLSVNAGSSTTNTTFTWNEVYGELRYDVKIWKDKVYNGDAYHIEWGTLSGYSIQLPAGTYEAYVDATHYFDCRMSNVVRFTVNPSYTIGHWAGGFKNGEGNNDKRNKKLLGNISTPSAVGETYILDYDKAMQNIPNGYYVKNIFATPAISDEWEEYSMGTTVTQKAGDMYYEYYYDPITYSITYNLNGGTNSSSNPSTYNVLYGFTLANPTKEGYTFAGWTDANGNKVYGINAGKNANFATDATYEEFCSELASRTTGDIVLNANWVANTYTVTYDANGGVFDLTDQTKTHGEDLTLSDSVPSLDGHTFLGWSIDPSAETAEYQPGDIFTVDADTTLYAVWSVTSSALPGDVNGDGSINSIDLSYMTRFIAGSSVKIGLGADVNNDGAVNAVDMALMKRIALGATVGKN